MKKKTGIVIAAFRKACGLKQVFMAHKLGISKEAYANIECDRSDINMGRLDAVAKLFSVKPYQIMVLAEEVKHNESNDGLLEAVKGMVRLTKIGLQLEELTMEDKYLLSMDQSVRGSVL